jgi:hypothetical protein
LFSGFKRLSSDLREMPTPVENVKIGVNTVTQIILKTER